MNQRSMAADSELNVQTDDHLAAKALRRRVWQQLTRGDDMAAGGDGEQAAARDAYREWSEIMRLNEQRVAKLSTVQGVRGYLVPFRDNRLVNLRHG